MPGTLRGAVASTRVGLGVWPTPVERVAVASGPELLVKRDDLSGFGRGGAKTRKLEFLLGHALAHGNDELITVTGNVTNLVFDLLPAADRLGVRSQILVVDYPAVARHDRARIFAGVTDRITLLGPSKGAAAARALALYARRRARGARPLLVLPGASHPASVLGNAAGMLELAEQLDVAQTPLPHTVYVAVATGTTLAGFLLGAEALRAAGRESVDVVGVSVDGGWTRAWTKTLVRWTERVLRLEHRVADARIAVLPLPAGDAFARVTGEMADTCARVKAHAGLALDPIFGARAWTALERLTPPGGRRDGRLPLFWHCGYTPEWAELGSAIRRAASPGTA